MSEQFKNQWKEKAQGKKFTVAISYQNKIIGSITVDANSATEAEVQVFNNIQIIAR